MNRLGRGEDTRTSSTWLQHCMEPVLQLSAAAARTTKARAEAAARRENMMSRWYVEIGLGKRAEAVPKRNGEASAFECCDFPWSPYTLYATRGGLCAGLHQAARPPNPSRWLSDIPVGRWLSVAVERGARRQRGPFEWALLDAAHRTPTRQHFNPEPRLASS